MSLRESSASRAEHSGDDVPRYLRRLGDRVRVLRTQHGLSRKALAEQADVSERYLAQLETGEGNGSIVLLRRIGQALGMPVAQLVSEEPDPSLEAVLFQQVLSRLTPAQLAEVRGLLQQHFGAASEDARRNRIALVGLRGGGKSTLGALLAKHLDVPFIELDREIELLTGASLDQIFAVFGQETFRRAEREALEKVLLQHQRFVMATSGSIVTEPRTLELLLSSCFTVWTQASPAEHMSRVVAQGDLRPMANSPRAMDDLVSILTSREPLYARAEATLSTSGKTPEQSLKELAELIRASAPRSSPSRAKHLTFGTERS